MTKFLLANANGHTTPSLSSLSNLVIPREKKCTQIPTEDLDSCSVAPRGGATTRFPGSTGGM